MTNYIVLAIPVFFLLIGIEMLAARLLEWDVYRLDDSVNDLACGVLQQILDVFLKTTLFAGYLFLYERHRLLTLPESGVAVWAFGFLGVDFLYYWFHRTSHERNALWAAHVVHHQSEEYNLTVALRQSAIQSSFSWVFYLPLALVGLPPLVFLTLSSFNTLYQFWIHTRLIGRLGPLEWVLNTPSHHRVHHARNPKYIDRNHGGTLIVWDRLFGTFVEERDEPLYGITVPLRSWNPVWANLASWADLLQKARAARGLPDKLRLFVERPGWRPPDLGGYSPPPEVDRAGLVKYATPLPRGLALYVLAQFTAVLLFVTLLLNTQRSLGRAEAALGALLVTASLVSLGGLFERRPWAPPLEAARLVLFPILAAALGLVAPGLPLAAALLLVPTALLLLWLARALRAA